MKNKAFVFFFLILFVSLSAFAGTNEIENRFLAAGLVDVATFAPSIQVDLVNADPEKNYFHEDFYQGLNKAYLQKDVAVKLAKAQTILKKKFSSFSLLILDAARPRSVSKAMYKKMQGTRFERYVANPSKGSMHNYGIAVDITIIDGQGKELDMGPTPFKRSTAAIYWQYFLAKAGKKISKKQKENRLLLKNTMREAGFHPLDFEWWHFNGIEKTEARKMYSLIE